MKQFLLFLFFLGSIYSLDAQRLVKVEAISDRDILVEDISDISLEIEFTVRLTNLSHDTLLIKWDKKVYSQPADWLTQVNDDNGIYLPNVHTNFGPIPGTDIPLSILPGQSTEISMHVLPLGTEGEGWYELSFSYADAPGYILESVDFRTSTGATASEYTNSKAEILVYPNPATFYFEVTPNNLVDEIDIINIVGGKIRSFPYEHGQRYSIANLPSGIYLVSLVNAKTGVIKTIRLVKRTFRT
ncbi:T9SS type A sorting domain-containing protein [Flavilitoribacter nigricans]|uniref:Secretion system C-terminal sorting domain-containing protein n=1 Tax=Flavilitoribacter nigricans (strain ATCC 23147 / DSM 23189 / NBRC 102662 / NCIMB 1420 / SS-2) TaxID=1122177 RepID=A0A2D0N5X7_FLAN2|nr:T9SS type A sorting domain-containing protein [Flavilitoribacter nigricans]PHN03904.1 hypothetical protein CRP01_23825 [Flavilitoribacter nigricans DSM 23189 = NBRC 102662]